VTDVAVAERLSALRERIARAAQRSGRRPDEVTLVGVSKRQPTDRVVAAARAGLRHVGENYVQEAEQKRAGVEAVLEPPLTGQLRWHFVGRLQRNKARQAAQLFHMVETLDRAVLGDELERRAAEADRRLAVLVQVDLSDEPQKGGAAPDALPELLAHSQTWPHLDLVGLMTIPRADRDPERTRPTFARLRELRDTLCEKPGGAQLRELSMGMSGDYEVAVEEGATMVRVGTALFGPRRT
jgi:pyridoxal phosphate enzyme (YggS family)